MFLDILCFIVIVEEIAHYAEFRILSNVKKADVPKIRIESINMNNN